MTVLAPSVLAEDGDGTALMDALVGASNVLYAPESRLPVQPPEMPGRVIACSTRPGDSRCGDGGEVIAAEAVHADPQCPAGL